MPDRSARPEDPSVSRKLSILAPLKPWGGIESKLVTLCREFNRLGVETELVRPRGGDIPYPDRLPASVSTVDLGTRSKGDGVPAFIRYLHQSRPDAVLTAKDHAAQVALIARLLGRDRTPVFVKITNTLSDVARRRFKRAMIRRLYPHADGIIANSQSGADDLVQHFRVPRDRLHVIYNPTVTTDFDERARQPVEHLWLAGDGPPVVIGAGRLTPQKNFANLIDAFARLRQMRPCRLIVLGEGPERERLIERAKARDVADAIDLPGAVDDALPWLARADVLALSSRYEGLANVLIEAMALGTPVVATACGGAAEILRDGELGPLVDTGAPEQLASALAATLSDPPSATRLIESTRRFQSEPIARQYLKTMDFLGAES
jgi:glycosyltransferase involved in cell wall biosynthesis